MNSPEICPICHHHIVPKRIHTDNITSNSNETIYKCNNPKCEHYFIAEYTFIFNGARNIYNLTNLIPQRIKPIEFKTDIESISPTFYKIFNQASEAEAYSLDEIAGVGYRKALEFLIKDYCISNNSEDEEDIKNRPLMQVINNYMMDAPKIQLAATKAVWLGNDETHYVRKWEDKDIKDLKILIHLVIHHLESEILLAQYEMDMQ